ncbi:MAG: response regulator [Schwartzia succinivorans]|nr:response regulator [Schwartzia succinivorans]
MILEDKSITVLIIDDDEINRQMAEMILKKNFEYRILTAESGMRGYELMQNQTVHLVLLDVSMPVWDGLKTLHFIRSNEKLKNTPVIMLTAAADRETVIKASSYGVKDYLRKPFLPDELTARVAKVIWDNWLQQDFDSLESDLDALLKSVEIK